MNKEVKQSLLSSNFIHEIKVSLPENSNLSAAEYQLYLSSEKLIQQKVAEWSEELAKQNSQKAVYG